MRRPWAALRTNLGNGIYVETIPYAEMELAPPNDGKSGYQTSVHRQLSPFTAEERHDSPDHETAARTHAALCEKWKDAEGGR